MTTNELREATERLRSLLSLTAVPHNFHVRDVHTESCLRCAIDRVLKGDA